MVINHTTDALIIIDMQNDFTYSTGSLYVSGGEEVVQPIINMCDRFQNLYFTQDAHPKNHTSFAFNHLQLPFDIIQMYGHDQVLWPNHCVESEPGFDIVEDLILEVDKAKVVIRKGKNPLVDSYSAFRENYGPDGNRATTGFGAMLHALGMRRLFFVGLARDFCVKFSCLDAIVEGFETYLIDNCTKSVYNDDNAVAKTTQELVNAGVKIIDSSEISL